MNVLNPGNPARTRAVWWQGVGDRRPAAGCWFKDHYTMPVCIQGYVDVRLESHVSVLCLMCMCDGK